MDSIGDNLDKHIKFAQYNEQPLLKKWAPTHNLSLLDGTHWYHGTALVVKAQGPLRCDLHEVVVTSNDDWSVFDNVKDLRGIYERGEGSQTVE